MTINSKCSTSFVIQYKLSLYPCNKGIKLRGISILLAFTCHCKLLKNCINKNKSLPMTKSY